MTVSTTDVVAPVFTAAEVVVLFASGVAGQAGFGDLLGRLVFERDDLCRVAFRDVLLAWSMTRLTASHLVFPTAQTAEFGVRSRDEVFELIFVTVFAGLASDVLLVASRHAGEIIGNSSYGDRERDQDQEDSECLAGEHLHFLF